MEMVKRYCNNIDIIFQNLYSSETKLFSTNFLTKYIINLYIKKVDFHYI